LFPCRRCLSVSFFSRNQRRWPSIFSPSLRPSHFTFVSAFPPVFLPLRVTLKTVALLPWASISFYFAFDFPVAEDDNDRCSLHRRRLCRFHPWLHVFFIRALSFLRVRTFDTHGFPVSRWLSARIEPSFLFLFVPTDHFRRVRSSLSGFFSGLSYLVLFFSPFPLFFF